MRFKFLFILILCNYLFAQSLLNRAVGGNDSFGSARSYGMGLTHSVNANNTSAIRYNPSLLSYISKDQNLIVDFQLNSSFIKERRSILVKDYFGDFLTYADYLNNDNFYNYIQGGMIINLKNITLATAFLPLTTFDYDYTEEVRGSADIEDGDVGMKDPLVGYQIFNTSGRLNTLSLGISLTGVLNNKNSYNFGFGYHKILDTEITDDIHIDSLTTQIENFSEVQDYYNKETFKDLGDYYSLGASYIDNQMIISFNIESDITIQTEGYQGLNFIDSTGVISYLDNSQFILSGINYYKPQKLNFGISYKSKNNSDLTVSAECEINQIKDTDNNYNYLKDYNIYKLGFEYILPSSTPIRAGLIYKTSPIVLMPDQSSITCGTGGKFKNIFYDLGISYSLFDYYYPDLFPVEGSLDNGFDKITESKFDFIFTIRYLF